MIPRCALLLVPLLASTAPGCSSSREGRVDGLTAVVAIGVDPGHFNPAITTAAHVHAVADSLFNGLVALDREGEPLPDLAARWEVEDGGRTYVFHLAEGVRWHDGRALRSRDVAFTFESVLLRHHARTRAGFAEILDAIETPDEGTVVFRFHRPFPSLLRRLDVTEAPILPAHVFEGGDPESHPANLAPIGTGPYRLAAHHRDDRIELVRNENYFKRGLPHFERLVFRVIPDEGTRILALEGGEVDYVGSLRPSDAQRLRDGAEFTVVSSASGPGGGNCITTWIFNLDRPALGDVRVRRALAHAVDREQIVERVLFGEGRVPDAPISSGIEWAHADGVLDRYAVDRERAELLLDQAGFAKGDEGRRLSIDVVHFPSFLKYGEILRQQLAEVGVALEVRAIERAAAIETMYVDRAFDTGIVSYCQGLDPDIGVRRMVELDSIGPVPFSNGAHYRSPEVSSLFAEAAAATGAAARGALYRKAQKILADDLPYWWLVETRSLTAYRSRLRGFAPWSGQFAEEARPAPVATTK